MCARLSRSGLPCGAHPRAPAGSGAHAARPRAERGSSPKRRSEVPGPAQDNGKSPRAWGPGMVSWRRWPLGCVCGTWVGAGDAPALRSQGVERAHEGSRRSCRGDRPSPGRAPRPALRFGQHRSAGTAGGSSCPRCCRRARVAGGGAVPTQTAAVSPRRRPGAGRAMPSQRVCLPRSLSRRTSA